MIFYGYCSACHGDLILAESRWTGQRYRVCKSCGQSDCPHVDWSRTLVPHLVRYAFPASCPDCLSDARKVANG